MSFYTKQTFEKSMGSYRDALHELLDIAGGSVRFSGTGSPHMDIYRNGHMEVSALASPALLPKATDSIARYESLFEYGRPKHVLPSHWIAKSSFFEVSVKAVRRWKSFERAGLTIDTAGRTVQGAHDKSWDCLLSLLIAKRSWGCADWHSKVGEIKEWGDGLPGDLRVKFMDSVDGATAEYDRWKSAIAEASEMAAAI